EPDPRGRVDAATKPTEEPGGVDDRRLHHAGPAVEHRVAEDRLQHGPHLVPAGAIDLLEAGARRGARRNGDEVAPELRDEERGVVRVVEAELHRVAPRERAALAED